MNLELFHIVVTVAMSAIGWIMKTQHGRIERISNELVEHKVKAAEEFARKSDFVRLENKIDRVLDKLDNKADRI